MNTDRIVAHQNQSVSNWHKGRHWKRVHSQTLKRVPTYIIILFAGAGLTAVNLVNIPFLILIGRFLSLKFIIKCGWSTRNLWHTESINTELRCLEEAWNFQRF